MKPFCRVRPPKDTFHIFRDDYRTSGQAGTVLSNARPFEWDEEKDAEHVSLLNAQGGFPIRLIIEGVVCHVTRKVLAV